MSDIEELLRRDARNWNSTRPENADLDALLPTLQGGSARTAHTTRWATPVAAVLAAVVVAGLAFFLAGGSSRSSRPSDIRVGPLVSTRMGPLLVRHPVAWRYIPQRMQPLGLDSGFGWLTNATAGKQCTFRQSAMSCRAPVRALRPGNVYISAGSDVRVAPPLQSAKQAFKFVPNRMVGGHPAELTQHPPVYLQDCPRGTTSRFALILEMGKTPAAYDGGIWYLTACAADPDRQTTTALTRMFASIRLSHLGSPVGHTFRVQLVLPATSVPANGQPIHAYALVINHTGRPVVIHDACNGWVAAGLIGKHATFGITSGDVACADKTISPGKTRVPLTIQTTFAACQQGKQPGTADIPHCLGPHDNRMPRLPAGSYRAKIETQSTSIRPILSPPQPIILTPVR